MVYLHAPGPRPAPRTRTWDASGLPLWFLTRAGGPLRELRSPGEEVPPDRRHLKGWARAVRPLEGNVEVSDLGTVLQARYRVPTGVWLHVVMEGRAGADGPPERLRTDRLFAVGGGEDPGPLELHAGPARYHVRLERTSEKGA